MYCRHIMWSVLIGIGFCVTWTFVTSLAKVLIELINSWVLFADYLSLGLGFSEEFQYYAT